MIMLRQAQYLRETLQSLQSVRLASLEPRQRLRVRVALRWVRANLDTAYDEFLRLQMLEGAAGVRVDTWWKKGPRGFKDAQARFEADDVLPSWFEKGNTGTYAMLKRVTESKIRSYGVQASFGDIVQNALMGIRLKAHMPGQSKPVPYAVGVRLSQGIRDGRETPFTATKGLLQKWLERKVQNEVRENETNLPETDEGATRPTKDISGADDGGSLLIEITFTNLTDPLGREIRQFMRKSWSSFQFMRKGKRTTEFMDRWLDLFEKTGKFPSLAKVGDSLEMSPSNFSNRFFRPAWHKFVNDLWKNKSLLNKLALRYETEGIPWLQQKPTMGEIEEALKQPGGKSKHRAAENNPWLLFLHTL